VQFANTVPEKFPVTMYSAVEQHSYHFLSTSNAADGCTMLKTPTLPNETGSPQELQGVPDRLEASVAESVTS
jgi:hypothetical protein